MTDDIVTRLREQVCECGYSASFNELHKCLRCEAIDEIERLWALSFKDIYFGQLKLDEIEYLQSENERLRSAISKIEQAIVEEGKMPTYHRAVMKRHRMEWGTLHNAIDKAIEALHE